MTAPQYTPQGFNGIFFDSSSGSEAMYKDRENFVDGVKDVGNGLFLSLAAHVDWNLNDDQGLAAVALAKAKKFWADADWQKLDGVLAQVNQLLAEKPENWRMQVFELVRDAAMPAHYFRPAEFVSYFFGESAYDTAFAIRGATLAIMSQHGYDQCEAALLIIGAYLNGAKELVADLESAFQRIWPQIELSLLHEMYQAATESRASGWDDWERSFSMTLQLALRGIATIDIMDLFPALQGVGVPASDLPETFEHYFVPREIMASVVAKGDDAITGFYASGLTLNRMVHILVVLDLNGMTDLRDKLESAVYLLYGADVTKIRPLYATVRELKEQLGDQWMSFAVATIDMAIDGHANIDWRHSC